MINLRYEEAHPQILTNGRHLSLARHCMIARSLPSRFHSETSVLLDHSLHPMLLSDHSLRLTLRHCLLGALYVMSGDDSRRSIFRPSS